MLQERREKNESSERTTISPEAERTSGLYDALKQDVTRHIDGRIYDNMFS